MLVLRIDDAARVIGIVEFDDMPADMMRGAVELHPHRLIEIAAQRLAPARLLADADIGGEQPDHRVHIAHVEREGIFGGELADRVERFQPVDPRGEIFRQNTSLR